MIEIGSKWQHKDGVVYEVEYAGVLKPEDNRVCYVDCIAAITNERCWVGFKEDFLEDFKPYEPVYEYQWAVQSKDTYGRIQLTSYKTESEFIEWESKQDETLVYQRLEFTKRERK